MTKKEAIESIKNATKAIGLLFYAEDEKFEAVKAKDSSQDVSVEGEYAKGTKVSVSSSTGSIPAPDGNYTLSNGKKFSTKGGVIDEVMADDSDEDFSKEGEVESVEVPEEAPAEKVEESESEEAKEPEAEKVEELDAKEAEMKELVEKVQGLEEAFNQLKEAFATKEDMKALGENFTAIKSAFEVLSDTPAEFSKVDKSVLAKEEKAKKLEALASIMSK